jgi:hypothetical protein
MKRGFFALVLALGLLVLLSPGTASAGAPVREFLPAPDFTFEGICPFPVGVHTISNNEYTITFVDDQGNPTRQVIQGLLISQLTNLNTGVSVVRNISGPGVFTFSDSTLNASGNWALAFFPGDLGPGSPGRLFINSGKIVVRFGEPDQILSQSGTQEDLCTTLAQT